MEVTHAKYATMGKNELAKQLVDRIREQVTLIEQLQAQAIKREARIKEMKKQTHTPRLGIRFVNQWTDSPDIEVCLFCLDVSLECGYPRLYVGLLGFLLEVGFEGYY